MNEIEMKQPLISVENAYYFSYSVAGLEKSSEMIVVGPFAKLEDISNNLRIIKTGNKDKDGKIMIESIFAANIDTKILWEK